MTLVQKNKTLSDIIQSKRGVSRNSARTWASTLRRIHREFSDEPWNLNLKWLTDEKILTKISNMINAQTNDKNLQTVLSMPEGENSQKIDKLKKLVSTNTNIFVQQQTDKLLQNSRDLQTIFKRGDFDSTQPRIQVKS